MPDPVVVDPNTPAPAPAPVTPPWYQGADPALIGHIQTKGWHDKTPAEAALAAAQSHREAELHFGVPADRIVKLPANPQDEAGWKAVYAKLGVPADPKDYDFSTVKKADGTPVDAALTDFLRAQAAALNLPKDAAPRFGSELLKYLDGQGAAAAADKTAKLAEEHKVLDANWGQNKEANTFLARKGAEKLGFDAETVTALENVVGFAKIMEALRKVGAAGSEDSFITNNGGFNNGVMTREQAISRKEELLRDEGWAKRYLDGDVQANRELQGLLTIIVGDDTEASRRA